MIPSAGERVDGAYNATGPTVMLPVELKMFFTMGQTTTTDEVALIPSPRTRFAA